MAANWNTRHGGDEEEEEIVFHKDPSSSLSTWDNAGLFQYDPEQDLPLHDNCEAHEVQTQQSHCRVMVREKDKLFNCWGIAILFLSLLGTILLAVFTHVYTSQQEHGQLMDPFTTTLAASHNNVLQRIQHDLQRQWETLEEILQQQSEDVTALASSSNARWPFWTMPTTDWERTAQHMRHLVSSLSLVGWAPLVEQDQTQLWERYSVYQYNHPSSNNNNSQQEVISDHVRGDVTGSTLAPICQVSPRRPESINYNLLSHRMDMTSVIEEWNTVQPHLEEDIVPVVSDWILSNEDIVMFLQQSAPMLSGGLFSLVMQPIFDTLVLESNVHNINIPNRTVVGILFGVLSWETFVMESLQQEDDQELLEVVLSNSCNEKQRYRYNGSSAEWNRLHPIQANQQSASNVWTLNKKTSLAGCRYEIQVAHHASFSDTTTNTTTQSTSLSATQFTFLLALILIILWSLVWCYIFGLYRQYNKMETLAIAAISVLKDMLPLSMCDRLLRDERKRQGCSKRLLRQCYKGQHRHPCAQHTSLCKASKKDINGSHNTVINAAIKDISGPALDDNPENALDLSVTNTTRRIQEELLVGSRAEFFPVVTVLVGDIDGFSAWASSRDPIHVFDLLETIIHTFDLIAKRRNVRKAETIADRYIALIPAQKEGFMHAVDMCKFARDCLDAFDTVTSSLEVSLGPDTSDLSMRFGLHSGPVTAGVVRGDGRSRFQIFGATVDMAARIQAQSEPKKILISQQTADFLAADDKTDWLIPREGEIHTNSKGLIQSFWLDPSAMEGRRSQRRMDMNDGSDKHHPTLKRAQSILRSRENGREMSRDLLTEREQRLIDWQVEQLYGLLLQIEAQRRLLKGAATIDDDDKMISVATIAQSEVAVFDEVQEVIKMPSLEPNAISYDGSRIDKAELNENVLWQLNDYVTTISTLYNKNYFHNFEHCCHVSLSAKKMLNRIVKADKQQTTTETGHEASDASTEAHKHEDDSAFGIMADPITQFAILFSALIHDVDHFGVSNAQLVKENHRLARIYHSLSVAEQHSVNLAWDLLMDPAFVDLRNAIYTTEEEYVRFRAMVVNVVMATDICDKDLKALRNARWDKAFSNKNDDQEATTLTKEDRDRRTTIIVEHLIQASDISHTMQHWHIYRKWNKLLFQEMYTAYTRGRMDQNPIDFWYAGEIGFFDFYIIPLAKKLKECGVFGVSCDEYLDYAVSNRAEWEAKGAVVVEEYRQWAKETFSDSYTS